MKFLVDFLINGPVRLSATFAWLPPLFARLVVGWVAVAGPSPVSLDRLLQNWREQQA